MTASCASPVLYGTGSFDTRRVMHEQPHRNTTRACLLVGARSRAERRLCLSALPAIGMSDGRSCHAEVVVYFGARNRWRLATTCAGVNSRLEAQGTSIGEWRCCLAVMVGYRLCGGTVRRERCAGALFLLVCWPLARARASKTSYGRGRTRRGLHICMPHCFLYATTHMLDVA